jgi:mono/diheme cytochrome c family protein
MLTTTHSGEAEMPSLRPLLLFPLLMLLGACAAGTSSAERTGAGTGALDGTDSVARGAYLVNLLGCARCHTEGYLLGQNATGPHLAGSQVGIAYTDSDEDLHPGLVFAPNLTPHDTGLGGWSRRDIVRALATGVGTDGHQRLPVMPWPNYMALSDPDLRAIADYLMSLPPVNRKIPEMTLPAESIAHPYVRFGVFVFTPFEADDAL